MLLRRHISVVSCHSVWKHCNCHAILMLGLDAFSTICFQWFCTLQISVHFSGFNCLLIPEKWLTRSRCHLGWWVGWAQTTMYFGPALGSDPLREGAFLAEEPLWWCGSSEITLWFLLIVIVAVSCWTLVDQKWWVMAALHQRSHRYTWRSVAVLASESRHKGSSASSSLGSLLVVEEIVSSVLQVPYSALKLLFGWQKGASGL